MRRFLALLFPLCVAFLVVSKGAQWISEFWWFEALGQHATWWKLMGWRAGAFGVAALLWGAVLGINLRLAWRHALAQRAPLSLLGGAMEGIELELSPSLRTARAGARAIVWGAAWLAGLAAANRFDLWMLALRGAATGGFEASAGLDLGFFLFRLPALSWAWSCLGIALIIALVCCLCLYLWLDAIETGPGILRASEFSRAHLSAMCGALVIWKGGACALDVVGAPVVFGWTPNGILGYPEQLAGVPASQFFAWSALPFAVFLLWCGWRERGRVALFSFMIWGAGAALLPSLAPAFVRSLGMMDEDAQRNAVVQHLDATRRAWDFAGTKETRIASEASFVATQMEHSATVALWPPGAARTAMNRAPGEESTKSRVSRVHVERGENGLELRAISQQNETSGVSPALQLVAPAGDAGPLRVQQQRLDQSLLTEAPATPLFNRFAPALETELDAPEFRVTPQPDYAVERAAPGACLVLAWRFFNAQLLRPGLPLAWHLEPVERAQTLAPFVNWSGAVARPVVLESGVGPRVYWMVEGCFTSHSFPGAATLPIGDNWAGINYARQSVLAVFDGTTGQSQLFLTAPNEPLARAWSRALPALWTPLDQLRPELRAQIQVSPALLDATTRVYAVYHPQSGDEVMAWQTQRSDWRATLSADDDTTLFWRDALLPDENGKLTRWQLCAFAPARGSVATKDAPVALSALVGRSFTGDGRARWQQWRPDKPLPLPEIAAPPKITLSNEGPATPPPPTRIGIIPTFDERGHADGFTVYRAEVLASDPKNPPILKVQAQTTGSFVRAPALDVATADALARARQLWDAILSARRESQWERAAQLETQLSEVLNAAPPERAAP